MTQPISDRDIKSSNGYAALFVSLAMLAFGAGLIIHEVYLVFQAPWNHAYSVNGIAILLGIVVGVVSLVLLSGIFQLDPNQAAVMTLFGNYVGTDKGTGLRWVNPFYNVQKVGCRLENHNIESIKVNDAAGNPIEIGASIVWHVADAAKATFQVNSHLKYVQIQSESALRKIASTHPYDDWSEKHDKDSSSGDARILTLRDGSDEVAKEIEDELSKHLAVAGLKVVDARITHLAYAPEIAHAMLKRQQAEAIVAARATIISGAVGLVKDAIEGLQDKGLNLDDERKAAMASNLLVVMVSDKDASPVINTGTLYG